MFIQSFFLNRQHLPQLNRINFQFPVEGVSKWCFEKKYNFTRFDYSGHGQSSGEFEDGGITKWSGEANEIFQNFKNKKNIIIGSSMGGWISLIVAKRNIETIVSLLIFITLCTRKKKR